jgi:nucleotide-binding universal stress UspA family protein
MAIARIFAPLSGAADSKTVAQVACDLAKRFRAQLIGCYVRKSAEPYAYFAALDSSSALQSSLLAAATPATNGQQEFARSTFESSCRAAGVKLGANEPAPSGAWLGTLDGARALGPAARLSDLIVVAQPRAHKNEGQMAVFDAALFHARRSVLVAHDSATGLTPKSVAIAYNGSAEAARAVTCALPFLREAQQVNILTSGRVLEGAPTAQDLIAYLAAHGIKATHRPSLEVSSTIENTLLGLAHVFDTDLLIMGAYTHSHLREKVLGGVTRFMLEKADVSVLMAH